MRARLVLGVSGYDVAVEQERLEKVLGIGVAGLLLSTALGDERAGEIGRTLDDIDVPVVLMERAFGFPHVEREYDHVRTDHAYGAMLALRHFGSQGHIRIGINLNASVTAYWLRQGTTQAADALDVDLLISPVVLPAHGEARTRWRYWTRSSTSARRTAPTRCWSTPTSMRPAWSNARWSEACGSPTTSR